MKKTYWLGGGAVLIGVFLMVLLLGNQPDNQLIDETGARVTEPVSLPASEETFDSTFRCPDESTFTTSYNLGSGLLTLKLSSGDEYELVQSVVPQGARYESRDARLVYEEFEGESTITIGRQVMVSGCVPLIE